MHIPGTSIPLCLICEDEPGTTRVDDIGMTCAECAVAAAAAVVALADARLYTCTPKKFDQPK